MRKFYLLAAAAVAALTMNAQDLYVCGQGVGLGWDPANPKTVSLSGNEYRFSVEDLVQFKISTSYGSWDDFNANAMTCVDITDDMLGQAIGLSAGDANIGTPWTGNYDIVVAGDLSTITLTTTTPKPTGFAAVYLRGDMNGWGSPEDWQMSTTDGVTYTFTCAGATAIQAGQKFKIADAGWGNINYGYGKAIELNTPMSWNYNATDSSMPATFEGTITFQLSGLKQPATVTFATGTGVDSVADEAAEAVYFDMQGVRVENPGKGLYIVRKGEKVSKVIL